LAAFRAAHPRRRLVIDGLQDWPGRIRLLDVDDDPGVRPPMRAALRALYPQAQVHTFHGAGHTPFLSQPDEYFAVVSAFLDAEMSGAVGAGGAGGA